jgi:hypothetical protein
MKITNLLFSSTQENKFMAVVRFSDELKKAVTDNAKALFSNRISAAYKASPPIADEVADLVYAQFMPAINTLPKEFLQWSNRVEIRVPYNTSSIEVSYQAAREYPKPNNRIKLDDDAIMDSMFSISLKLPDTPKYKTYIEQIAVWHEGVKALEKQRDEFVDGVKKVIEAHTTLAPALKAWPPLWDLVPETFRERHRKVVERTKPASTAELDVDLTSLTAAVTIAKITR